MSSVSERIKLIRKQAQKTQEAFGESLGVNRGVVTNWEDAENRLPNGVPTTAIKLICATYNVNYKWLTTGEGEMYALESPEEKADRLIAQYAPGETEFSKAIIRAFTNLPDSEWEKLKKIIDEFKGIKKEGAE